LTRLKVGTPWLTRFRAISKGKGGWFRRESIVAFLLALRWVWVEASRDPAYGDFSDHMCSRTRHFKQIPPSLTLFLPIIIRIFVVQPALPGSRTMDSFPSISSSSLWNSVSFEYLLFYLLHIPQKSYFYICSMSHFSLKLALQTAAEFLSSFQRAL